MYTYILPELPAETWALRPRQNGREAEAKYCRCLKSQVLDCIREIENEKVKSLKKCLHFSICACHPCAGAMLFFPVSFQY